MESGIKLFIQITKMTRANLADEDEFLLNRKPSIIG
jgi:hypothetical protein